MLQGQVICRILKRFYLYIKMERVYIVDKAFEKSNFSIAKFETGDYESCRFIQIDFSNANLSDINFNDCEFLSCNMSMAKISNTGFRDIVFEDCKLLGLHFENSNPFLFKVNFERCILNISSLYTLKLKNTRFVDSSIREVDFTEADLTGSIFKNCDLSGSVFDKTILEKVDFRTSYNYSIDPESNRIKKAKFSRDGISGLLDKHDIDIE